MKIIYPLDWDRTSLTPEITIYDERPNRNLRLAVFSVENSVFTELPDVKAIEARSSRGFTRIFSLIGLDSKGAYAVRIYDATFDILQDSIGFLADDEVAHVSLVPALDEVELLFVHCRTARFIANGIGKSGTTWLYRLLGTLPGVSCLDMSANGLNGIDHHELDRVPPATVYHGHLNCSWENRKSLENLNFHNVHVHRDLRDVIVSEYFHKFHMQRGQHSPHLLAKSAEDMLSFDSIYKWSTTIYNARTVLDWKESGDCVLTSYERLLTEPEAEFSRILQGLGLPFHPNLSKVIVASNEFKKLSGRANGNSDPNSPLRKGIIGDWCNHMSEETAQHIVDRYGEYYKVLGYSTDCRKPERIDPQTVQSSIEVAPDDYLDII